MQPDGTISGNLMRDTAIIAAVRECIEQHKPVTYENTAAIIAAQNLEGFGELLQEEFSDAFGIVADQHVAELEPKSEPEPDEAPAAAAAPAKPRAMTPAEADAAREALRLANKALCAARAAVTTATNRRLTARGRLADAVAAWSSGLPRITAEENARDYIASQLAEKAAKLTAGVPATHKRVANSYIDQAAAYSHGGDGNTFLRKQMRRGHRRFNRGDVMTAQGIKRLPAEE